jgi:hypothetical protein
MRSVNKRTARASLDELEQLPFPTPAGVSVATFAGFDAEGHFQVKLSGADDPMMALSTIGLTATDIGGQVVVAYEGEPGGRLIIIGCLRERAVPPVPGMKVDGERVVIRAEREIELRCGDASIILTQAGKVLIRGNFVLSRSRGANKVQGAFVHIN